MPTRKLILLLMLMAAFAVIGGCNPAPKPAPKRPQVTLAPTVPPVLSPSPSPVASVKPAPVVQPSPAKKK